MKDPETNALLEGAQTLLRELECTRARGMVQIPNYGAVKDAIITLSVEENASVMVQIPSYVAVKDSQILPTKTKKDSPGSMGLSANDAVHQDVQT